MARGGVSRGAGLYPPGLGAAFDEPFLGDVVP